MTGSDRTIEQLVKRFVDTQAQEAVALERQDTKAQNRWADRRQAILGELLVQGEAGRAALERLLVHELPMVRSAAATNVLKWAPELALPVLQDLMVWARSVRDAHGRRPATATFVLFNAEAVLALHYDIDINDVLPRVLGVEE